MEEWLAELQTLSDIAKTEPQAALSCLTHGLQSKYTFLLRTTPDIIELVQPIQTFIEDTLLPNIFGRAISDELMRVAKLPCREGGLGIIDLTRQSFLEKSLHISEPLIESVVSGSFELMESIFSLQQRRKNQVYKSNRAESKQRLTEVLDECSNDLKRMVLLASERGASAWLTMLPIETEGFSLTKSNFRDALCLRYGLTPDHMPVKCACSKDFNVEQALSCSKGGFPIVRHNEIRDLFANVLSQVCHDVALEPQLQEVDRTLTPGSNSQAGARLDISASGVWGGRFEKTLFDVRVFSPLCKTNSGPIQQTYRRHETDKRRNYESRVLEIEGASFCPIVLSTSGGQAPATQALVKRLATLLSEKLDIPRPITTSWLRNRLSMAITRSCIMCLRGARSRSKAPARAWDPYAIETSNSLTQSTLEN